MGDHMIKVALIAEYDPSFEPHAATERALRHSAAAAGIEIKREWISTEDLGPGLYGEFQGLWIGPGSPYRNMQKTLEVIRHARENDVPLLGTCGGFQHVILEIARNMLGFKDAEHAEYDPYASDLFISELACSLAGREMALSLAEGSKAAALYGSTRTIERYYCNFGVNPAYVEELRKAPIRISGSDAEGEIRVVEIPAHRFFIATLFVPQARSTRSAPHPLVDGFVKAVRESLTRSF
jgi:CTP synthase (UTP-ammonia lyase)